jgi:hypothetical protein
LHAELPYYAGLESAVKKLWTKNEIFLKTLNTTVMDIRGLFLNQAAKQGVTCYQSNMHSLGYSSFYSETILSQKFLQASKPMKVEQMHVFNIRMTNIYANE